MPLPIPLAKGLYKDSIFFVGDDMLKSQFATLEIPNKDEAFFVDVSQSIDEVVAKCKTFISSVTDAT